MTAYLITNALLMIFGLTVKFPIVYKPVLRFNMWFSTIVAALTYAAVELAALPSSPVYDRPAAHLILYCISILVCIILARPDRIMEILIMEYFYQALYNILGTAIMAILTVAYGALSGADSTTWFSKSTSTASDYVLRFATLAICFAVSLVICRRCMPLVLNVSRKLKRLLFAGVILPVIVFVTLKIIINPDASQVLAGPLVICYGMLLLMVAVTLLIFFISIFLHSKEENNLIQARLEAQNIHYHKVLEIQQELREAKHDLANRMAAYNISGSARDR